MQKTIRVLGIETSCDETGIAIYDSEQGLLADELYSQVTIHEQFGGVVPELASRDHVRKIMPLIDQAMAKAKIKASDINGVAYTQGPGLLGALLIGACVGRTLAFAWGVPAVGVHHMEAHLLAALLEDNPPPFPFVALLVSGGHTMLVRVDGIGRYELLGESLDDAAGEAFDKTAKLLGLGYPGGPALAKLAEKGDKSRFNFPRPMVDRPGLDFSFSGLKTAVLNAWNNSEQQEQTKADIAAAFQEAVVDTLVIKCRRSLVATGLSSLVMAGGVSANRVLRERLSHELKKINGTICYPRPEFCTDNGAMVAYAGYRRLQLGQQDTLEIKVRARYPLTEINI